jgi:hypothetical protein
LLFAENVVIASPSCASLARFQKRFSIPIAAKSAATVIT